MLIFKKILTIFLRMDSLVMMIFILGCVPDELPKVQGQYFGWLHHQSISTQVYGDIPQYQDEGTKGYSISFNLYPLSALSDPISFKIRFIRDEGVIIACSLFDHEHLLKIKNTCAVSDDASLCFSRDHLDFNIKADAANFTSFTLSKQSNAVSYEVEHTYTLDELMGRVRFTSFKRAQETENLFQAKERLLRASLNTIPRLNFKDAIGVLAGDPQKLYEMVGDLLPFLFPANGYEFRKENKLLEAQKNSYAAIRGNEMQVVQTLFYLAHKERMLIDSLETYGSWLGSIEKVVNAQEQNLTVPMSSTSHFKLFLLNVQHDIRELRQLLNQDLLELSSASGIDAFNPISSFETFPLEDLSSLPPLDELSLYEKTQDRSLELSAFRSLVSASQSATQETKYGYWDPSRDQKIGFDLVHTLNISQSNTQKLKSQMQEFNELLKTQIRSLASIYNEAKEQYALSNQTLALKKGGLNLLTKRYLTGDPSLDPRQYIENLTTLSQEVLIEEEKKIAYVHAYWITKAKMDRLIRGGPYEKLDVALPYVE